MPHSLTRWTPAVILMIAGSTQSLAAGPFGADFELSSLNGTNGFVCNGIDGGDSSGGSVSSAGDVNGDGIDDLIIGASGGDPNGGGSGESYVVFGGVGVGAGGTLELSMLNGADGFVCNGIDAGDYSGYSVSSAGDVNGDGIDDLIIGAPNADPNGASGASESYVVFGGVGVGAGGTLELSMLNGADGFVCNGIDADDRSTSVSSAGDVNGDGIDDLVIGARFADPNGGGSGESYVVFGGIGVGSGGTIELSSLNGTNGFVCNGIDAGDRSGRSVSCAGDVNGDGIDDLIIGAYGADPNGASYSGESYVIFGGIGVGSGGSLELSTLNGTNGFVCNGIVADDRSGYSVSCAGDVNGDGIDDLIIGASGADPNGASYSGESYVVFGAIGVGSGGTLELSSLNGTNGFVCNGIDTRDFSGSSVSGAGDVNGDGIDDLIIGAVGADPNGSQGGGANGSQSGESYVVFGNNSLGAGGTLELANLRAASGAEGDYGFVLNGIDANDFSGASVSSAGDVNGDGIDDLIIGASGGDPNGESYVVFGKGDTSLAGDINGDGVVDTADLGILLGQFGMMSSYAAGMFGAEFELSSLNGTNGFVCNGIDAGDNSGWSVSGAGDANGDGIDDLIIGAYAADPHGFTSGESYVVFGGIGVGSGGTLELSSLNGANGFVCNGIDASDSSGRSVSGAGDVNGDGIDDLIIGASGGDPNGASYGGESYVVFGGIGVGSGGTLELSSLNGANGFVCNGIDASDSSGRSVSGAGDVNGDGIDDLIIGARFAGPNGANFSGESYVVFGAIGVGSGGTLELSSLNGTNGFVCNGIDAGDYSGHSVSSAGDVNGDGIDDLIIGANGGVFGASSESYVVFGGVGVGSGGALELSSLNGANGFVCNEIDAGDHSGGSVSSAGDVNGDGIDDLIIGAERADPNGAGDSGESYVVFGGVGVGSGGTLVLSSLNGTNGFVCNGIDAGDYSGYSVSSAGDVNGDGIDDLFIGARYAGPNGANFSGESYVVFGNSSLGAGGTFELANLQAARGAEGDYGFVLNGIDAGDRSGGFVSSTGDVNGDGTDDLVIGASGADPNGASFSGESYVVFGRGPLPGDINGDGVVDTADLGILLGQFGMMSP